MSENIGSEETTTLSQDWKNNLPERVRGWDEVKNSDSAEKFFDQIGNQRSLMGQSIRVPGEDAGAETMEEFYSKLQSKVPGLMRTPDPEDEDSINHVLEALGKPKDENGYSLDESANATEEQLTELREIAKEANLTKKQFKSVAEKILAAKKSGKDASSAHFEKEESLLRKDWGAAYDERMAIAVDIAERTGAPDSLTEAIKTKNVDADTVKWLHTMAKQLGGEIEVPSAVNKNTILSPDEARESIQDIMDNSEHPYWKNGHPAHDAAVKKVVGLHRLAAG